MPPTTHNMSKANPEWISGNWNPRPVKTPVPMMLAITIPHAVTKPMVRGGAGVFTDGRSATLLIAGSRADFVATITDGLKSARRYSPYHAFELVRCCQKRRLASFWKHHENNHLPGNEDATRGISRKSARRARARVRSPGQSRDQYSRTHRFGHGRSCSCPHDRQRRDQGVDAAGRARRARV